MNLNEYKVVFDAQLHNVWHKEFEIPDHLKPLWDHLWPVLWGGKRIRGYLADVVLGTLNEPSRLSLALELLHAFALVHDDIIDRSDTRRGAPAVHCGIGKMKKNAHTGVSYALLLGDWLLIESYDQLEMFFEEAKIEKTPQKKIRKQWRQLLHEMLWGQMMDIELETDMTLPMEYIEEKTKLKTALYTFVRPLTLALESQDAAKKTIEWATVWGTKIGLGFQVQDDLLDLMGDPKKTGKPVMTDIGENSGTFFRAWMMTNATEKYQKEMEPFWGKQKINADECQVIKTILTEAGAIDAGKIHIAQYFLEAKELLEMSPLEAPQTDALKSIWHALVAREA
jgi:geranylgeranyl diphosphate synthase type I